METNEYNRVSLFQFYFVFAVKMGRFVNGEKNTVSYHLILSFFYIRGPKNEGGKMEYGLAMNLNINGN